MITVGTRCTVQRRLSWSSSHVDHQWEAVVVKVTPKRAYLSERSWFALDDAKREVMPRYLRYMTVVVGVGQAPSVDTTTKEKM